MKIMGSVSTISCKGSMGESFKDSRNTNVGPLKGVKRRTLVID